MNETDAVLGTTELRPTSRRPERSCIEMPDEATEIRFINEAGTILMSNGILAMGE